MTRILVVDDEIQIRRALDINLRAHGYDVELAATGEEALTEAAANPPDLVLLDLGLPGLDGIDVIRGLRGWTSMPIIVLSARDGESTRWPRSMPAPTTTSPSRSASTSCWPGCAPHCAGTIPRRRAGRRDRRLRRRPGEQAGHPRRRVGAPHADGMGDRRASRAQPGRLVTQRQLLQDVWGPQYESETNYLRVHLAAIRRKLEPDPGQPRYFITEPGIGYRFEPS